MKKTILIIEDDQSLAEALRIILESEGYNAQVFADGQMIAGKIALTDPDMVIVDYRLPGDDGLVVTANIRAQKHLQSLPVILMSASHSNFNTDLKTLNIKKFLQKPFEIDVFLESVKASL